MDQRAEEDEAAGQCAAKVSLAMVWGVLSFSRTFPGNPQSRPPTRCPLTVSFLGQGSPTEIDHGKRATLILTSLLEDLVGKICQKLIDGSFKGRHTIAVDNPTRSSSTGSLPKQVGKRALLGDLGKICQKLIDGSPKGRHRMAGDNHFLLPVL